MKSGNIILLFIGLVLMGAAVLPALAVFPAMDVLDMGGCTGKDYPCVPVTVYGTIHWTGRQEVTSIIVNVELPSGMGYSNAVYADGNGNYWVNGIPAWDVIAPPWHHYEGTIDVLVGGNIVDSGTYWRTTDGGGTTHSENWVSGDSYRLDFTVNTPGEPNDEPVDQEHPHDTTIIQTETAGDIMCGLLLIGLGLVLLAVFWRF